MSPEKNGEASHTRIGRVLFCTSRKGTYGSAWTTPFSLLFSPRLLWPRPFLIKEHFVLKAHCTWDLFSYHSRNLGGSFLWPELADIYIVPLCLFSCDAHSKDV